MRDLLEKTIFSFKVKYLPKEWRGGVHICTEPGRVQWTLPWARRDLALVRDTKVPLNLGKQWHRTGVKLEDSLRTIVFTVVGVSGHFSDFPPLLTISSKAKNTPLDALIERWFSQNCQTPTFYQPPSVNIATIITVITIQVLACRSNNFNLHYCYTASLPPPPLFPLFCF